MSARRVASLAVASASFEGTAVLPEATPTTAPTVVTAVAEATANPRTEIRLTRFPSSIARVVTSRTQSRPLTLASLLRRITSRRSDGSQEALARWVLPVTEGPGVARAAYG